MLSPRPRAYGDSLQITIHPADDQAHVRGLDFQLGSLVRRLSRIDPTVQPVLFVQHRSGRVAPGSVSINTEAQDVDEVEIETEDSLGEIGYEKISHACQDLPLGTPPKWNRTHSRNT